MLRTLAVANYRSLNHITIPLTNLNVITGANGSGKSNLYRALRLLANTAQGGVVNALAREGGLQSTFWAGPHKISRAMRRGDVPIQGTRHNTRQRMRLGFGSDEFSYAISLGLPSPPQGAFALDPHIKRECIWAGPVFRPAALSVDRDGPRVRVREDRKWRVLDTRINEFDSVFTQLADPQSAPEVSHLRERIRCWRFYDHFRTDYGAPARWPQVGTRTVQLHHDGGDVAAAIQTILEIGDRSALDDAVGDAFDDAQVSVEISDEHWFSLKFHQHGLLRSLAAAELSDGTLRYLLWIAALLTPRPPPLMVLNEPETSLHPNLLPSLARLIIKASENTQIWVVSHSTRLAAALAESARCNTMRLDKTLGETHLMGQKPLDAPPWSWPENR